LTTDPGFALEDFIELENERRITRLIERNVQRKVELLKRIQELHAQRKQVREILVRSEEQWPKQQFGLASLSRHEFLISVLAQISAVVFADDETIIQPGTLEERHVG
jgi:hypothetical protein